MFKKLVKKGEYGERLEYLNEKGQYHREDGPAVVYKNLINVFWYLNGKGYSKEEYKKEMYKRNLKKLNETI